MRLTKLEHASLILEDSGKKLFLDPGSFTTAITEAAQTVAIVITHEHPDHWTPEQIDRILSKNPDARIFGPAGVAAAAGALPVEIVSAGDKIEAGPFTLEFFGEKHAIIHESIPVVDNVGVLVNGSVYYGGDSYTVPEGIEIDVHAVPAGAPWLRIGDVMNYVLSVKPRRSFPTHEMTLSKAGKDMSNARIKWATEQNGGEFFPLVPGDTLDI
jgi:L-ascorbate metabolism protein UlaG (beta-lactamase superfamily)